MLGDPVGISLDPRLGRGADRFGQYAADAVGLVDDARLGFGQHLGRDVMGGDACPDAFRPVQPRAGQRQELSEPTVQPRQMPAAAHIGKQADTGFGHGEPRIFGRHAVFARQCNAHAAAHGDAVHEGHDGLSISRTAGG